MKRTIPLSASILLALGFSAAAQAPAKVTYNDHVLPIFRNACLNCHNPDKKKAGLDLSTYQGTIAGSDNGKVLESGNPGKSLLFTCTKQTEEPKMPPKGDRLTDSELAILEKWITGQLLESATSKGIAAANNVQLAVVSLERPAGPPPMPATDLPLEPVVRTKATDALVALAASPWAPLVAVGGQKQIVLYNTDTLQPLGILPFPEGFPAIVRFSRNGQLLLTGGGLGGKLGKVVLWDVRTGERAGEVGNEFDQVLGADVSPDHAHVALGGPSKLLKIFATKDGKQLHSLKKHTDWVTAVTFSPDGKFLASADRSGGVVVWEGATGKEYNTLPGHKVMVTALAFMPGVLASASEDGTIVLWDVKEAKEIRKWNAHAGGALWVDFTPDGRVVSCGRDKIAKVWDQTGKAIMTSEQFPDLALRATLAGDRVVAGDWTGQIRVFNVADGKRLGELTANPPSIAEQLAAAEKRLADAKGALPALQQAVAAAEQKAQEASAATADSNAVAELTKKLEAQNAEIAALREARAKHAEGSPEYAAANEKVQAKKTEVAATQSALEAAQKAGATPKPNGGAEELAKAKAALEQADAQVASAAREVERWTRAKDFMSVHKAKEALADLKDRYEDAVATAKDALAPAEKIRADIAELEKAVAAAPALLKEKEKTLAEAHAAIAPAAQALSAAEAALAEKEAAAKNSGDGLNKAISEAMELARKLEAQTAEVAKLREARAKFGEGSPEYAAANEKVQAKKAEIAQIETTLAAAKAKAEELKPKGEPMTGEIAKAKEAVEKARGEAKAASDKVAEAEAALAKAKKEAAAQKTALADLRKKAPEVARTAQATRTKAEQDAAALAKELQTAKVATEKAKAEFQKRYGAEAKASPPVAAKAP
jgi:WD40 repeat protein